MHQALSVTGEAIICKHPLGSPLVSSFPYSSHPVCSREQLLQEAQPLKDKFSPLVFSQLAACLLVQEQTVGSFHSPPSFPSSCSRSRPQSLPPSEPNKFQTSATNRKGRLLPSHCGKKLLCSIKTWKTCKTSVNRLRVHTPICERGHSS